MGTASWGAEVTKKGPKVHTHWETNQRVYRMEQEERRGRRMKVRIRKIMALVKEGFSVAQVRLNQFRVNGRLDLFPLHNEWHDTATNKRGSAGDLIALVKEWMKS